MIYLDRHGLNVSEFIRKGKTKVFPLSEKEAALEEARRRKSYSYLLRSYKKKETPKICGYAVPN